MPGVEGVDTSERLRDKLTFDGVAMTSNMPCAALLLNVGVLWRCEELFAERLDLSPCWAVLYMLLTVMSAVSTSKDLLGIWDRERDRASDSDFVSRRSLFSDGNCFLSWSEMCLALSNDVDLCFD